MPLMIQLPDVTETKFLRNCFWSVRCDVEPKSAFQTVALIRVREPEEAGLPKSTVGELVNAAFLASCLVRSAAACFLHSIV
jgi:hypothetical protein